MRSQTLALVATGIAVGGSGSAHADMITYMSQTRSISAYAIDHVANVTDSHAASAPDFGPFNTSVSAAAGAGRGGATMSSTLDVATGINISASVTGIGSINQMCEGGGSGSYNISFTLNQATAATLSYATLGGTFSLNGPGVSIMAGIAESVGPITMMLAPGDYTFSGNCSLSNHSFGTGVYSAATLTVPSPMSASALLFGAGMACLGRRGRRGPR